MEASPVVTCSACGCTSRDSACCEFCNANLTPVSLPVAPSTCPISPEGPFYLSAKLAGLLTRPEASVTLYTPEKSWRLHWISSDLWPEWKPRVEERLAAAASNRGSKIEDRGWRMEDGGSKVRDRESSSADPQLPPIHLPSSILHPRSSLTALPLCRIVEDLTGVWVVAEATGRRPEPWRGPVSEDPLDRLRHLAGVAGRGPGFWDENPAESLGQMVAFLERVADAMESLHGAGLVWLPFHPNGIEEVKRQESGIRSQESGIGGQEPENKSQESGRSSPLATHHSPLTTWVRSTNMDLAVCLIGSLAYRPRLVPAWAPPEVVREHISEIGPRTDVYHLALFTYYWLSRLLPNGFPGKGLASFEFEMPPLRILAPTLPVGIASMVMSGLSVEPGRRPASPRAFCAELRAGVDGVRKREDRGSSRRKGNESKVMSDESSVASDQQRVARPERREEHDDAPVSTPFEDSGRATQSSPHHSSLITHHSSPWDIGSHTRTGRAKAFKGGVNQDTVLVRRFTQPDRALVVVADGLSCCDVGSGDVASRLVCDAIDASLGAESQAENFSKEIPEACRRGAEAILAWALDRGERLRLKTAQDLMSTTVLAAWMEGDSLLLANAGDSRAYLINESGVEQLTVDADLGCTLLAAGSPPENVIELGPVTRALRSCVGGVLYKSATDELIVDDARLRLVINRWKLLPGETVILCSDGLVEEGAFLEPAELLELVRCNADLSADALAFALAEAADARQSLPSQEEPDGCGDNISCCVIRISQ